MMRALAIVTEWFASMPTDRMLTTPTVSTSELRPLISPTPPLDAHAKVFNATRADSHVANTAHAANAEAPMLH